MIIVIMGVSGSGKTTIGTLLAEALRCSFLEGDSLHSKENIEKMSHGIPLNDRDRAPWLAAIHVRLLEFFKRGESLVVACSALEQQYREVLADGVPITWVYLKGSKELIRSRMKHRPKHFMKANMLDSQFEALEEPSDAIVVDISLPSLAIVAQILARLRQPSSTLRNDAAPQDVEKKRVVG
jgi:gluconokinase